jgi:hypothetical protein
MRHGFEKLDTRLSSHLHKKARTAGSENWEFLRGYHELLVQWEEANGCEYLFLKFEGYPSVSIPHIRSYFHKKKTGQGLDVNPELLLQAETDDELEISKRSAENYSKAYKAVLKTLGFKSLMKNKGEIVNVREAILAMVERCRKIAKLSNFDRHFIVVLDTKLRRKGLEPNMRLDNRFSNRTVAEILEIVIEYCQTVRCDPDPFIAAVLAATDDLRRIANELRRDERMGRTHTVRYFEEISVTPEQVDWRLQRAVQLLS